MLHDPAKMKHGISVRTRGSIAVLFLALFSSYATAALTTAPATAPVKPPATTRAAAPSTKPLPILSADEVVSQLTAETEKLLLSGQPFAFHRPHPIMKQLEPHSALKILSRLSKPFTGDAVRDTYIRYHLLWAVLDDGNAQKEFSTARFVELTNALPPDVVYEVKQARTYDPPDVAARYEQLANSCRVKTGFPPFEKYVWPPESFEFMSPADRTVAEANWAEAMKLKGTFKVTIDPDANAFNERMLFIKWMQHQVRGESVYGMLMCGDANAFDSVITQIADHARDDADLTAELLNFVNAAYFNGWLGQYPPAKLKAASAKLKSVVLAADAAAAGNKTPTRIRRKNLTELAYTLIVAMDSGNVPTRAPSSILVRPAPDFTPPKLAKRKVTPQTIDNNTLDDAIDRAVAAIERYRPPDEDLGGLSYKASDVVEGQSDWREVYFTPGQQGLAVWAMMQAGESKQQFWLQKRVGWLACMESVSVFDRAIRLQTLSQMPLKRWELWLHRDVDWLASAMTTQGGYNATYAGGPNPGYGDNVNSQYAVLGFWAAEEAGLDVEPAVWKKVDQYWRDSQFPAENGSAGWAPANHKTIKAGANTNAFTNRVAGPMTAAGVLSLSLSERFLNGPKMVGVGNKVSPELASGLKWLDEHFSIDDIDGDSDLYYYLWSIQNVGLASGYRTFNKVDWFRTATARLLNEQAPDGLWKGPKGSMVSTSFALLYLARARGPLAICKVRFGDESHWNNRPNDMVNFVDYVSKQFETPTSWQIADLDQPVFELIESATLYLATDKPFTLKPEEVKRLREYCDAGGLLIAAPEGSNVGGVVKSLKALAAAMYPELEVQKVPPTHPFYKLIDKASPTNSMWMIDNGVRPTMVIVERDLSRELQADSAKSRDAFKLLTNLYMYAAGQDSRRPRTQTNYIAAAAGKLTRKVTAARVKHAGNFDPEPLGLQQLKAGLAAKSGVDLTVTTAEPTALGDAKIAFLTIGERDELKDDQAKALRSWIDAGGTLWLDAAGGSSSAAGSADATLAKLGLKSSDLSGGTDLPLFTAKDLKGGTPVENVSYRPFVEGEKTRLQVAKIKDRSAVYFTHGDLSSALAGVNAWKIAGYSVPTARRLVTNSVLAVK